VYKTKSKQAQLNLLLRLEEDLLIIISYLLIWHVTYKLYHAFIESSEDVSTFSPRDDRLLFPLIQITSCKIYGKLEHVTQYVFYFCIHVTALQWGFARSRFHHGTWNPFLDTKFDLQDHSVTTYLTPRENYKLNSVPIEEIKQTSLIYLCKSDFPLMTQ